jgi:hypothetical protein
MYLKFIQAEYEDREKGSETLNFDDIIGEV